MQYVIPVRAPRPYWYTEGYCLQLSATCSASTCKMFPWRRWCFVLKYFSQQNLTSSLLQPNEDHNRCNYSNSSMTPLNYCRWWNATLQRVRRFPYELQREQSCLEAVGIPGYVGLEWMVGKHKSQKKIMIITTIINSRGVGCLLNLPIGSNWRFYGH